ncbi:MAG: hypothetical protein IKD59_02195 [Lachnospiraceae bacterium]|nr:hypothetical protein [Lachnospiraceae bacterium]
MASRRKVTLENLDDAIADILKQYEGDVVDKTKEITAAVTKEGVQAIKNESLMKFSNVDLPRGRYGSGWTSQLETGRFSAQGIIYNSKYPGLPHLLEHGHIVRTTGKRTPGSKDEVEGVEHIAKVEEKITQEYIQKIEAGL